ncbi:transporter substrate-binding domain-containing protein [Candidatus Clavichlamydia salmonicola]|uniref:transporter substrate-binding domain-containing protein n=1 Tax=Candidatus Clavichlamydia salmonicola TaxID=469812 RepID=UPI001890CA29|nr:transporter substrate-binding domain-containing protein [Candidatus Clavichlamydia salmonicola]
MKIFIIVLLVSLTIGCTACSQNNKKDKSAFLLVGTDPTFPPFESINSKGHTIGFDIDIAEKIATKLNKKLVVRHLDFDALFFSLMQSKIDLVISAISITEERAKQVNFIPYQGEGIDHLSLVFWKQQPERFEEFKGIVAVQTGTFHEKFLRAVATKDMRIKSFSSVQELILELKFGKSNAAILEPSVLKLMMLRFPELTASPILLGDEYRVHGYGIAINKNNQKLSHEIEEVINDLKADGSIQILEKKWLYSPCVG